MTDDRKRKKSTPIFPRIHICSQEDADTYQAGQDVFLMLIGIKCALITDESTVGDFFCSVSTDEENRHEAHKLDTALGRTVGWGEYVWEVARELEEKRPDLCFKATTGIDPQ